jgi:uncharacterized protein (DUF1330 family)
VAAYLIVEIDVRDPAGYEEYKTLAAQSVHAFGGRYLARGGEAQALEGDWTPRRVVILEFPSAGRAREWWSSQEYGKARDIRRRTADARMILVEGIA